MHLSISEDNKAQNFHIHNQEVGKSQSTRDTLSREVRVSVNNEKANLEPTRHSPVGFSHSLFTCSRAPKISRSIRTQQTIHIDYALSLFSPSTFLLDEKTQCSCYLPSCIDAKELEQDIKVYLKPQQ